MKVYMKTGETRHMDNVDVPDNVALAIAKKPYVTGVDFTPSRRYGDWNFEQKRLSEEQKRSKTKQVA